MLLCAVRGALAVADVAAASKVAAAATAKGGARGQARFRRAEARRPPVASHDVLRSALPALYDARGAGAAVARDALRDRVGFVRG